jgi:DNA repair protein RadC
VQGFKPIKEWANDEKPREKFIKKGKTVLSNSELLAIIISTGTSNRSALDLAREILQICNQNLHALSRWSIADYCKIEGIGPAKAVSISACLELANRRLNSGNSEKTTIKNSFDAYALMQQHLENLSHEEFWIVTLNRKNTIINSYKISEGGITATIVDQRKLFKLALDDKCTGIILYHNHPSGNNVPSEADDSLTKKIINSGKLLDINVIDHIIVAHSSYYSYADHGKL